LGALIIIKEEEVFIEGIHTGMNANWFKTLLDTDADITISYPSFDMCPIITVYFK